MTQKGRDQKTGQYEKGHRLTAVRHGAYSDRLPLRIRKYSALVRAELMRQTTDMVLQEPWPITESTVTDSQD